MASETEIRKAFAKEAREIKQVESVCELSVWQTKDYENAASDSESILLTASGGIAIIGFVFARLITSEPGAAETNRLGVEAELLNIAVLPEFRQNRVGSLLLAGMMEILVEYGPFSVFLEVRESNTAARAFYLANDFEAVGTRNGYYRDPIENAVLMKYSREL